MKKQNFKAITKKTTPLHKQDQKNIKGGFIGVEDMDISITVEDDIIIDDDEID